MGNTNQQGSHDLGPTAHQLQVLYDAQLGQVTQQIGRSTQYLIRELSFSNQESLQKTLSWITRLQRDAQPTVATLVHAEQNRLINMCGSQSKLRLVFQYSSFSMYDEIEARKNSHYKYFDYVDCCRIIVGCVRALARIEEQIQQFSDLFASGIYHRIFVNPERLLIMRNGVVKIVSPLCVSPYDRFHHRQNCYYSPEKLIDFDYPEDEKSCIFQLGLTLIHILTLESCKSVYNGFEVKQDEIDQKILLVWRIFHDKLLCQMLSKMTRIFRSARATIKECLELVDLLEVWAANTDAHLTPSFERRTNEHISQRSLAWSETHRRLNVSEEEKQNRMVVANSANESATQSIFSYQNKIVSQAPWVKIRKPKNNQSQFKVEQVGLDQDPKQSQVVLNQFQSNIGMMITSNSLSRGKQSYCYGNQLTQGLICAEGGRSSRFEWKRTQFNKNSKDSKKKKDKRKATLDFINETIGMEMENENHYKD